MSDLTASPVTTAGTASTGRSAPADHRLRSASLLAAAAAGPAFAVLGSTQALVRDGFDLTRHSWSLLANGDWGWLYQATMIGAGALALLGGLALRRHLGSRAVPRLIALYGAFVVLAGIFRADAMDGFPVGTPAGPPATITTAGLLHLVTGGVAFACLIAACLVVGRRLRRAGARWATASTAVGLLYLAAFVGIGTGAGSPVIVLSFVVAVLLGWAWLTALFVAARSGRLHPAV